MLHMERDAAENRARAHTRPEAQKIREWAVHEVLNASPRGNTDAVITAADRLATYVLTGEVSA